MSWTAGAGVIEGGQKRVLVLSGTTKALTEADNLIGELTDISGIGASKETTEYGGLHYLTKKKSTGQSTPNDVQFTENLTSTALETRRSQYKNGTKFYTAVADAEGTVLYACHGEISEWGLEINDGDTCKLTYTMALDDDDVDGVTVTPVSNG